MMRMVSVKGLLLPLAMGALAMGGCGGGDETPTPEPTPTATPAPTPTPKPPVDDWFRATTMVVGDSDTGVDVDGDGTVDNNIESTLDTVNTTIYTSIEEAVCAVEGVDCSVDPYATVLEAVQTILDAVFSVDALSAAINGPIEAGTLNYLQNFNGANLDSAITLKWTGGTFEGLGYKPGATLGTQAGALASGAGLFGPGNLSLSLQFETPTTPGGQGGGTVDFEVVLYQGFSEVLSGYNKEELPDDTFVTGGAISMADMMEIVNEALGRVEDAINKIPEENRPDIDFDAISATVETALEANSDVTLSSGKGFSVGLAVNAKAITLQE